MAQTRRLHHVALGAADVASVAQFYRTVFGLTERARHDDDSGELRSIWLTSGELLLMVERTAQPPRRFDGVGSGPFLLAFAVEPEERAALESRLISAGAEIEDRTDFSSYARDPEGNRVAISHWPDAGA